MEGRTGFLVCLICSFCLIYEGEATLGDGCTDNSNCDSTSYEECNGTTSGSVCICSAGYYESGTSCLAAKLTGSSCDNPSTTGASATAQCAGANAQCVDSGGGQYKCLCPTNYYDNNGDGTSGGDCMSTKATGSSCDNPSTTGASATAQCAGANAQCVDSGGGQYKCLCPTNYYDDNGDGTSGGDCMSTKATGSSCDNPSTTGASATAQCAGANAQCVDSGGGQYKCLCPANYYDNNGDGTSGGDCMSTKLTGSSCDNPSTTGASATAQCAGANAQCVDSGGGQYKCLCPTNYYDDNGDATSGGDCMSTKATGSSCDNPSTTGASATAQCAGANAQCVDSGGGQYKCLCPTNYYDDNGDGTSGGDCMSTKPTGSSCDDPSTTGASATAQCAGANAQCVDSGGGQYKCLCPTNYYDDNGDGTSGGDCMSTKLTGSSCDNPSTTGASATAQCAGANAQCVDSGGGLYKCLCPTNYYDDNGDGTSGGDCMSTKLTGSSCDNPSTTGTSATAQCAGANAQCVDSGGGQYKCLCPTNYYDDNGDATSGGHCVSTKPTGSLCDNPSTTGASATAQCAGANAQCVDSGGGQYKCLCPTNYYDDNGDGTSGGDCMLKKVTGSSCDNPSTAQCAGANAQCVDSGGGQYKCLCPTNYYDDNGDGTLGGDCMSTKPTGSSCVNPSTTGASATAQCAGANAQCVDSGGGQYKCLCPTNYYDNNGDGTSGGDCVSTKLTGSSCDNPSTTGASATAQCAGANAQCVDSGGGQYKCLCPTNYYDDNGDATSGGHCVSSKLTGSSCDNPSTTGASATAQCAGANAQCVDSGGGQYKCLCPTNYYDDNGDGTSGGDCVSTKPTGSSCDNPSTTGASATAQCAGANAQCVDSGGGQYKCLCPTNYYDNNGDGTTGGDCVSTKATGSSCDNPSTTGASATAQCAGANAQCVDSGGGQYKCLCPTNYYDDNGDGTSGGDCVSTKLTGSSCDNPSTTGASATAQCAGANAQCVDSGGGQFKCLCPTNYYDNNGDGTSGGDCVSTKPTGSSCDNPSTTGASATAQCAGANAQCVDSGGGQYKCLCPTNYYDNNGDGTTGGDCVSTKPTGSSCDNPSTTGASATAQCAGANAQCDDSGGGQYKCLCPTNYYDDNGDRTSGGDCISKVDVGAVCPVPTGSVPDTTTCADSNARCTLSSANYVCSCLATYYSYGGKCNAQEGLGEFCPAGIPAGEPCADSNARCTGEKCTCINTYYDSNGAGNTGGQCILKKGLGETCPTGIPDWEPCSDDNARCTGTCTCKDTYYNSKGAGNTDGQCIPEVNLGSPCTMTEACGTPNAVCENSKCVCGDAFYDDNGSQLKGTCTLKIELNQYCTYSSTINDQCSDRNAECRPNNFGANTCLCNADYSQSEGKCNPNQGVGGDCNTATAGACSDANANCINNKCICNIDSYDDNGLQLGGDCRPMTELQVSVPITSSPATTGFNVVWTAPEKSQHVSGYTLQWQPKDNSVGGGSADVGTATSYSVISGVTAGQVYIVTVVSRNDVTQQNSPRTITSLPKEQAAKPNKPGNIIQGASNFDAEDKGIRVGWNAPAGRVSGYIVKLLDDGTELTSETVASTQGNLYYANMLNGHRYTISITSLSESFADGDKVLSEVYVEEIKTIPKVPGPPRNVKCAEEFKQMIRLTWLPPIQPKGDIKQYHIMVIKLDSTVYSDHTAGSDKTTKDILGLQPGSYYKFEMIIENELYNSSTKATTAGFCTTTAGVSEPPSGLIVTDVTSRSVAFKWSDPVNTYSEENLGYLVQVKDADANCKEMIYKCSNCFKSFELSDLQSLCNDQGPLTERLSSQLDGTQVYNATGLNPDIQYTVTVAAINIEGKGQTATVAQQTAEEVPAKPDISSIHTITPTSFTVDWSIADPRPGNTTYEITVDTQLPAQAKTTTVTGFSRRTTMIDGLEENWPYTVSVSAQTSVGSQTSAEESILTKPSAPGKVNNFEVDRVPGGSYNEWKVSWKIPLTLERNSNITSYRFIHNGTTVLQDKVLTAKVESHLYEETIGVEPEKFYSVEVYAVNVDGENGESMRYFAESLAGVPAPPVQVDFQSIKSSIVTTQRTSIAITVAAENFELTQNGRLRKTGLVCCSRNTCIQLQANMLTGDSTGYASMDVATWDSMPSWHNASKDNKYTPWRPTKDNWVEAQQGRSKRATNDVQYHIGVEDCSSDTTGYCNGPLVEDMEFMVYVVLCTNGGCLVSKPSGPYKTLPVPEDKPSIGMIVGIVVGVVVLIAVGLVVGLFIIRRRRNRNPMRPIDEELPKIDPTVNIQRKRPKKLSEFNDYLEKMHKDSNLQFSAEYEDIKALSAQHSQDASNKDENKLKNRYINILPFDHSLVKLSSNGEDDGQDYINANYLPGYKSQREYIGCQGPIPGTIDDFWRMIWEQNVSVVVMLTLCKEGQKVKCEQYWPDEIKEPKQYGDIIVEVQSYSNIKTYDYRIFTLTVGNKSMNVKHFHFLSWMDFSANVQTGIMIDFIKQVRSHVQPPDTAGPIIVHCSAGVGRTGTYITLDHLMQFVEDHDVSDSTVDIFDMVLSLRENRPHMVQTEQQYIFIHDCLKEIIEKKRQSQIYQNLGFEGEENIYQNEETIPMYENFKFGQEPRTNL